MNIVGLRREGTGLTLKQVVDAAKVVMKYLNLCKRPNSLKVGKLTDEPFNLSCETIWKSNTTARLKQLLDGLDESEIPNHGRLQTATVSLR